MCEAILILPRYCHYWWEITVVLTDIETSVSVFLISSESDAQVFSHKMLSSANNMCVLF